jgi:RNA polymerase sigma-70 factor (ECF subfamily)
LEDVNGTSALAVGFAGTLSHETGFRTNEREPLPGPRSEAALPQRLVDENIGWLQGWVRGRVADADLAHDICQDAFLKALRSLSRLKDLSRFPAWLYRIAQNTLRDHMRSRARRHRSFSRVEDLDALASAAPAAAESLDAAEEAERLLRAVRALPARYRDPLLLRHARDLSYAEIGSILGVSEKVIQVRMFRARKMLEKMLQGGS